METGAASDSTGEGPTARCYRGDSLGTSNGPQASPCPLPLSLVVLSSDDQRCCEEAGPGRRRVLVAVLLGVAGGGCVGGGPGVSCPPPSPSTLSHPVLLGGSVGSW